MIKPIEPSDPFSDLSYPTAVQSSLQSGASFARYDPSGKFVIAGLPNGQAAVWDLDTKASIRWLKGHVKAVTSAECVSSFRINHRQRLTRLIQLSEAGRGTPASCSPRPRTGTLSYGTWRLMLTHLNDTRRYASTRLCCLPPFTR